MCTHTQRFIRTIYICIYSHNIYTCINVDVVSVNVDIYIYIHDMYTFDRLNIVAINAILVLHVGTTGLRTVGRMSLRHHVIFIFHDI